MAVDLTSNYSGVVLNQNVPSTGSYPWRADGAGWVYQTFYLPDNYELGADADELRYPDLSGFQILVNVDAYNADTASVDYTLDYYSGGWNNLAQGTVIGAHAGASQVWMDIVFPDSVPVTQIIANSVMRIGVATRTAVGAAHSVPVTEVAPHSYAVEDQTITAILTPEVPYPITVNGVPSFLLLQDTNVYYSVQQGVSALWYVTPNPLVRRSNVSGALAVSVQQLSEQGQAYQADCVTPLVGTPASINFRLLALTADSGVDFLGNEYRSCVIQSAGGNVVTTDGFNSLTGNQNNPFWLSAPQPSRFAVVSQYFDVRPVPINPTVEDINFIGNPNYGYDSPGQAPIWWQAVNSPTTLAVRNNVLSTGDPNYTPWVDQGTQALYLANSFPSASANAFVAIQGPTPISLKGQTTIAMSYRYNLLASNGAGLYGQMSWYNMTGTLITTTRTPLITTLGVGTLSYVFNIPANAVTGRPSLGAVNPTTSSAAFSAYIDSVQMTFTPTVQPYFDGDMVDNAWAAQHGASASIQFGTPTANDASVVIDGVFLNPITPNIAFNVYYSNDSAGTSDNMTERDWEQKLWTRVPASYVATQSQEYVFPNPIQAQYIKVEYSNLQSRSYTPGNFQAPLRYKKFPSWVANFFIAQMQQPSFVASLVNVQYDALNFAYNYYLDDLGQEPDAPLAAPSSLAPQLTSYFSSQVTTGIDATTLGQIKLIMNTFAEPLGTIANPSLLGTYTNTLAQNNQTPAAPEGSNLGPVDYSTVSSLTREPVLFEQSLPVMYFFLPCRHTYKELSATLEVNRAYFAGVNEVALIRHDYTVADDTSLYIETGGDTFNTERSDFVIDSDSNWYAY